jgi:hypothetical protein
MIVKIRDVNLEEMDARLGAATSTRLSRAASPRVALEIIGGALGGKIAVAAEVLPSDTILCRVSLGGAMLGLGCER